MRAFDLSATCTGLLALGAGDVHVRRARQAWDVEAKAATLVAEMMRGVR